MLNCCGGSHRPPRDVSVCSHFTSSSRSCNKAQKSFAGLCWHEVSCGWKSKTFGSKSLLWTDSILIMGWQWSSCIWGNTGEHETGTVKHINCILKVITMMSEGVEATDRGQPVCHCPSFVPAPPTKFDLKTQIYLLYLWDVNSNITWQYSPVPAKIFVTWAGTSTNDERDDKRWAPFLSLSLPAFNISFQTREMWGCEVHLDVVWCTSSPESSSSLNQINIQPREALGSLCDRLYLVVSG